MRVERVRYYLAAVESGSLRAAAAACGVTQPALGQQISLLEEELDVVLLTRSRAGVRATPAGEALLDPMSRMVAAEDAVRGAAMDAGGRFHGRVEVGGGSVTIETVVAPALGRVRAQHPGLRFALHEGASADLEAAVLSGGLDLAVVTTPSTPPPVGLTRRHLLTAPVGIHVPLDHALAGEPSVAWSDLGRWSLVTMRRGTVLWQLLHAHVPQPDVVVQAMSARTVRVMVQQGAGIGLLARFGSAAETDGTVWVPVRGAAPITVSLVRRLGSQPSRSASVVTRSVQERAAELADLTGESERLTARTEPGSGDARRRGRGPRP